MKIIFSLGMFLCLAIGAHAQEFTGQSPEQGIEGVALFKDDGKGKAGDEAAEFRTSDSIIHCQVQLKETKPTLVKMLMIAVEVKGFKSGSKVITAAYKTNGEQGIINFRASDSDGWQPGKYRMDILLDEKLTKSIEFTITQTEAPADAKTKLTTKSKTFVSKKKKKG